MNHRFFNFKMRISGRDWELLSEKMKQENPFYTRKAQRDWFFNHLNRFCRDTALPYIEDHNRRSSRLEKRILIQEIPFDNSTNIEIVKAFAELKKMGVTQVIQKYIVDTFIISEERNQLDNTIRPNMTSPAKAKDKKLFRVLVADDDFDDFYFIKTVFKELGFDNAHLSHVESGRYLVELLRAQAKSSRFGQLPNIILLDLVMPYLSGFEVLEQIRAHETLCKIPVIILSHSASQPDIDRCYSLGASCYVNKPALISEWSATLKNLCLFWMQAVSYA